MLSVAKLTLGQEAYYERQVARGLDDYYAGRGESPGIWAGAGSAGLGLVGVVGDDDLGTLLRGVNPANAHRLRSPVRERTITRRRLDVETGEWREEPMQLKPVSGYDLVFSCPKSVSLLHALTRSEDVRRGISEAHEQAWQSALGYLEREACIVRRGKGGTIREHGEGFVAAAFRHRTSRAQDPHLHTHVVVANMTRTGDGEWRALDGEAILKTYRLAAGYLYEAHLRHELTRRLGVEWTEPVKGMGELRGVPEETIRAFSTRRQLLVEHMEALGTEGFTASRVAALATREAKEQVDLPRLREDWKARAAEQGLGRRELEALRRDRPVARDLVELEQLAARVLGRGGITEKQTTFTMPELIRAVAGALPSGGSVDEVLELADELSRFPGVELVGAQEEPGRPARFTTRELLSVEREAIELALTGLNVPVPAPERRSLAEGLMATGYELTGEQRMLVHEAACRSDRVVCVVGVAGSGKTLALCALADAYRGIDVEVLGAAPSGRAADELQSVTGIPSRTLHRLLLDAQRDGGLPRGCVLVVDEAGMAATRVLGPLLHAVERAEGKLLLVGDPAQLPAVGAGGLYQALCDRLDVIELSGNRRQRDPLEREALAGLRHGDPEPYLAHAARHHRLAVDDNPAIVKERLLADWWQEARRSPTRNVMLAYHRSDVDELNQAAHALMLHGRRLGAEAVTLGEREYRVGEQVLCRRNDDRLGLRNGMRGTIIDLDERGFIVRDRSGVNRRVDFSYAAEYLGYGYALTGHAAQGITVDRAFVLLPDQGALQEWGYVACTRARLQTRLYLADRDALERETPLREADPAAPPERTARALERSSAEPLALDQRREPRDTIRTFVAQQQEKLERDRERTTEQLAAAMRELEQLHWWNRDRRAELQSEIALHNKTLGRADHRASQLRRDAELRAERLAQRSKKLAPSRERDELTPSLQPERSRRSPTIKLDREPPGRGLRAVIEGCLLSPLASGCHGAAESPASELDRRLLPRRQRERRAHRGADRSRRRSRPGTGTGVSERPASLAPGGPSRDDRGRPGPTAAVVSDRIASVAADAQAGEEGRGRHERDLRGARPSRPEAVPPLLRARQPGARARARRACAGDALRHGEERRRGGATSGLPNGSTAGRPVLRHQPATGDRPRLSAAIAVTFMLWWVRSTREEAPWRSNSSSGQVRSLRAISLVTSRIRSSHGSTRSSSPRSMRSQTSSTQSRRHARNSTCRRRRSAAGSIGSPRRSAASSAAASRTQPGTRSSTSPTPSTSNSR